LAGQTSIVVHGSRTAALQITSRYNYGVFSAAAVLILMMGVTPVNLAMAKTIDAVAVLPSVGTPITLLASAQDTQQQHDRTQGNYSIRTAHFSLQRIHTIPAC
jgi:hypothetical protein